MLGGRRWKDIGCASVSGTRHLARATWLPRPCLQERRPEVRARAYRARILLAARSARGAKEWAPRRAPIKVAEPVALSSTLPTNFRLPPTAARLGFDLLALRARRKRDSRGVKTSIQGPSERRGRNLQKIQFSTFSTGRKPVLWTFLWIGANAPHPQKASAQSRARNTTSWGIGLQRPPFVNLT